MTLIDPAQPEHVRFVWGFRIARLPPDTTKTFVFDFGNTGISKKSDGLTHPQKNELKRLIKKFLPGWEKISFILLVILIVGLMCFSFLAGLLISMLYPNRADNN